MSTKNTLLWCAIAAGLFGFIFLYQRHVHPPPAGPGKMLPELRPEAVTSILVRPSGPGQLLIRADRTNDTWQLSRPQSYPAQAERVKKLLSFLDQLAPATYITGSVLRNHPNADEEFGFATPQATLVIQQGPYVPRLRVGALTNPGDQVYVQVEGDLGAYVVDAELLKYLPRSANEWRDTTMLDLADLVFDRLAVTNSAKGDTGRGGLPPSSSTFILLRDPTNSLWRMVWPLDARANHPRIEESLQELQQLRIREFVSDDPNPDLEPFGLAPPELELGFATGTNALALLQFGRCPTNDLTRVYARRAGQAGVVTVDKALLLAWCAFLNDFRDPRLLNSTAQVDSVEMLRGEERSSLVRHADGEWRVLPGDFPADPMLASSLLSSLTNMTIVKFVNDVANSADLPEYGLAAPLSRFRLKSKSTSTNEATTNTVVTELDFGIGTNSQDKVFAKRSDETFVYGVSTNDFNRLPAASWQLRDRKLCRFSQDDVTGLAWRQRGKICQMIHKGTLSWTFAPGSQGIINDGAIEETVRGVVQVSAITWVARGEQSRAAYGFAPEGYRLTLDLKSGEKFDLEFGGEAPSGNVYAAVTLEGQPWILEFPWLLFRDIASYLPLTASR
jgi:hypothetical protein